MSSPLTTPKGILGMTVFIVEDSQPVRERLADIVHNVEGIEIVGEAANFDDAIHGILSKRPDVAILDVRLADNRGSGIDVLNHVKAQLPALKAIVISNFATPQHMKASADAGARYFLDKTAEFELIDPILREFYAEKTRETPQAN
jgi:DNA-binding NarL/FixJ family response regulator